MPTDRHIIRRVGEDHFGTCVLHQRRPAVRICCIGTQNAVATELPEIARVPEHLGIFALWTVGFYVLGNALFVFSQRRFADEV